MLLYYIVSTVQMGKARLQHALGHIELRAMCKLSTEALSLGK